MKRAWLVLGCLLALTACAVDPKARPTPTLEPLPTVAHPKAENAKDRDTAAVLSAARRLDPCALLDLGEARLPGIPTGTETERDGPFRCRLDIEDSVDQVSLSIVDLPTEERLELSTEPIGGMRSYRMAENNACAVYLPMSFRLAVKITAEQIDGDVQPCDAVGALAEQAVARLDAPEQMESEPRWDACTVLATALNTDMATVSAASEWDVSSCESDEANLGLRDADDTAGDTSVQVDDDFRGLCLVSANAGGLGISVTHPSCDEAKRIAEPVMEIVAAPPPAGEPQRPVLYPWDEPDMPNPGGCRYVADPTCQPYVEVPVPEGEPVEVLRHALADPNIQCALATGAFDADLTPVTTGTKCHFVGPDGRTVSTYLQAGSSYVAGSEETEVGGRPAEILVDDKQGYLLVALAENLPGDVVLIVSTQGRTEEQTLRTVAEDILDRHFS